LNNIFC